jgi:hypothetical protein
MSYRSRIESLKNKLSTDSNQINTNYPLENNINNLSNKNNIYKSENIDNEYEYSVNKLEKFLDSKIVNMYNRPWTKLENKLKIYKINEFLDKYCDQKDKENYYDILLKALKLKQLKSANINYNYETCDIEFIKYKNIKLEKLE